MVRVLINTKWKPFTDPYCTTKHNAQLELSIWMTDGSGCALGQNIYMYTGIQRTQHTQYKHIYMYREMLVMHFERDVGHL